MAGAALFGNWLHLLNVSIFIVQLKIDLYGFHDLVLSTVYVEFRTIFESASPWPLERGAWAQGFISHQSKGWFERRHEVRLSERRTIGTWQRRLLPSKHLVTRAIFYLFYLEMCKRREIPSPYQDAKF